MYTTIAVSQDLSNDCHANERADLGQDVYSSAVMSIKWVTIAVYQPPGANYSDDYLPAHVAVSLPPTP